jgi:tetratricopeptide (TPR) repeat protein
MDLERLESGDILGDEVTGVLRVGAFLEGFDIPDSAEFSHWKDRQQARLLPLIKDSLVVLIDRCRRTGDTYQIERLADRMLALDELSEEAIRAKMEARAFAGDRLTALEIFERWKKKLAEELHAVPSDLVEGMAVRLRRRGWERTILPEVPNVPTDQWRGRCFIGRNREYRTLYEVWEQARNSNPKNALVLGDSGVGKTTLVQRLITAAGLQGAAISRVQCYDAEREIPYSTLHSLVLGLLDRPGASAASPEALSELSRIVPEVKHRFHNLPPSLETQGESTRLRVTEAFSDLLTSIAEEHPVMLVVDDLHYSDDVTLGVLHLIMRRVQRRSLMIVLIARTDELHQSPRGIRFKENIAPLALNEIELLPLSIEESHEILTSLKAFYQLELDKSEEAALLTAAAGYPMVIELLVQDWKATGQESCALSLDAMSAEYSQRGSAELAYCQLLGRMIRSLDPPTQSVLNVASILGRRLNDLRMYSIVDLGTLQIMTGMAELVSRRVLRDGPQGLEFVNELVRAAAYMSIPSTLRRTLHASVADRLIQAQNDDDPPSGLTIAWHCTRGNRIKEATPHLLKGARDAIRRGASYEAERALSTALADLTSSDKVEALVLLAEALQEQGKWQESLSVLDQVPKDDCCMWADMIFVLRTRARRWLGYISSADLVNLPDRLLEMIQLTVNRSTQIKAAVEAASALNNIFKSNESTRRLFETLSRVDTHELDTDDKARLLLGKAMCLYALRDFHLSLTMINEAISMLKETHTFNSVLAMLYNGLGAILSKQGYYTDSIPAYLLSSETALRVGHDRLYLQANANLALSWTRLGEYQLAIGAAHKALDINLAAAQLYHFPASQSAIRSHAMLGQQEEAEKITTQWVHAYSSFSFKGSLQAWRLYLADAFAITGKIQEAEEAGCGATLGCDSEVPTDFCVGPYARWLARSTYAANVTSAGYEILDGLLAGIGEFDVIDQVEILNARCWLDSMTRSNSSNDFARLLLQHLNQMPIAVAEQLARMGMLGFL